MSLLDHFDAAESAFFEKQLEHRYAETYDVIYPQFKGREMVPVSNEAEAGSETVTYEQFDQHGQAKIIDRKSKDIPRVDISGAEFPRPVRTIADSWGWDWVEVQNAVKARRNLNAKKANAGRREIERVIDEVAAVGSPTHGIPSGVVNDADVAISPATGVWSSLTADQIITDVGTLYRAVLSQSLGEHRPTHLILPDDQEALITTLPRATGTDTTVKEFLQEKFKIVIEPWYRMASAGAGSVDRAMMYLRDPDMLQQEIPQEFIQLPVQEQGLEFVVNALARTAGTAIYYPLSMRYMDGI